eukprot:2174858-Prymnesium_polylepis.1
MASELGFGASGAMFLECGHMVGTWSPARGSWHLERCRSGALGRRDFVRPEFTAMLNDAGGPCW